MSLKQRIHSMASDLHEEIRANRRHIHANPELSFCEQNTSKYIQSKLDEMGIEYQAGVADTGIVGYIKGQNPESKVVALRADIDALPIIEQNDVDYKSTNEGVMHACGHDVHTSSLLGASKILNSIKQDLEGTVKLIFQPGEEKLPGGASLMIKEGVLKNPEPANIVGQHVMPLIDAGKVGFRSGMYMASADEIYITVKGKGGHAAMPEFNVDPVVIASHLIVGLQQIVSRSASPKVPSVLSFGKVTAAGATNIIPNEVKIEGTFRTMNEKWRYEAHDKIYKMARELCSAMGGSCVIDIRVGYPFLQNEPELTDAMILHAKDYMGEENVEELDLWMAAEDFAFYSQEVDACFYRLGIRNEAKGITSGLHTPTFDVDEDCLPVGAGLMAYLTAQQLQ